MAKKRRQLSCVYRSSTDLAQLQGGGGMLITEKELQAGHDVRREGGPGIAA